MSAYPEIGPIIKRGDKYGMRIIICKRINLIINLDIKITFKMEFGKYRRSAIYCTRCCQLQLFAGIGGDRATVVYIVCPPILINSSPTKIIIRNNPVIHPVGIHSVAHTGLEIGLSGPGLCLLHSSPGGNLQMEIAADQRCAAAGHGAGARDVFGQEIIFFVCLDLE